MQETLMMIKPDAVERGLTGKILAHAQEAGLEIVRLRMVHLTEAEAREFYAVHEGKPFLDELVSFMSRSPVVAAVGRHPEAVTLWRTAMGATNPAQADPGTIRKLYATSIGENAVHGSDSPENAATEIAFFGMELELR
jgi:nucleoside-diphosphate kinase